MPPEITENTASSTSFLARRQIQLAVAGGVVLIVILTGLTLTLSARGISIVSNIMLTCLCLLPMVICLFPVYLLLVAAIYGVNRVNEMASTQLERVDDAAEAFKARSTALTENLNRRSIHLSAMLARLDPLFSIFDRPKSDGDHLNGS